MVWLSKPYHPCRPHHPKAGFSFWGISATPTASSPSSLILSSAFVCEGKQRLRQQRHPPLRPHGSHARHLPHELSSPSFRSRSRRRHLLRQHHRRAWPNAPAIFAKDRFRFRRVNQIVSKRMGKRQQMGLSQRGAHLLPRDPPESPALGTEPRKIGRYIVDPRKLRDHIHDLRDSTSRAAGPGCRAMLLFYSNKRTNLNRHCKVPQKPHYPYGSGFP